MIHIRRLGEVGIVVQDLARSLAWYREKLGFELQFEVENGVVIGRGDTSLWLCPEAPGFEAEPGDDAGQTLFGFEVSPEELQRVPAEFPEDPDIVHLDHPRYESYIVEDLDGHAIEFFAMKPGVVTQPKGEERIVALVDVVGFGGLVRGRSDEEMFRMLDCFYRAVEERVAQVGGHALKYMGDALLLVFPTERARTVVSCLESLGEDLRSVWDDFGTVCKVRLKADVLYLAWGELGQAAAFDGIGHGLNRLFLEAGGGHSVSPALWELAERQDG